MIEKELNLKRQLSENIPKNPKSSLRINKGSEDQDCEIVFVSSKSESKPYRQNQEYSLSEEEREESITQLRDQYIREKMQRKKEALRLKKEQFGSSSSDDDSVEFGMKETSSEESEKINHEVEEKIRENSLYGSNEEKADISNPLSKGQRVHQLKGKDNWAEQELTLRESTLLIGKYQMPIASIHKVKSMPELLNKELLKLKLNAEESNEVLLGVQAKTLLTVKGSSEKMPLHYVVFATIITKKLELMGIRSYSPEKSLPGIPESLLMGSHIHGKILKKSQHLGRWEERLVVVNAQGIYSYKRFNEKHSMFIGAESVRELWTRFETVEQNLLVVKLIHSSNTKTEFGIPVTDFFNEKNWLFQFYRLGISASLHKK